MQSCAPASRSVPSRGGETREATRRDERLGEQREWRKCAESSWLLEGTRSCLYSSTSDLESLNSKLAYTMTDCFVRTWVHV